MAVLSLENNVADIVTDKDKANQYRQRLEPILTEMTKIMVEAARENLVVNIQMAPDHFGIARPVITIMKPL
jgi:hypothetical protein